eukprot:876821_1
MNLEPTSSTAGTTSVGESGDKACDEDWDSDRTISDAEMLHEHIFGATRFRSVEEEDPTGMSVESMAHQPIDSPSPSPSPSTQSSQTVSSTESSKRPANHIILSPVSPPLKRQKVEKSTTNSKKSNSDGLKCDNCSQLFSARSNLQKHLKSCANVVCAECSVTCKLRSDMDTHMVQYHGGYKCETCVLDRRYRTWMYFKRHLSRKLCMRVQCAQCERKFSTASLMAAHALEAHCGQKCTRCQKNFTNPMSFRVHVHRAFCGPNRNPKRTQKSKKAVKCADGKGGAEFTNKEEHDISAEAMIQHPFIDPPLPSPSTQSSRSVSSNESSKRPANHMISSHISPPVKRQKVENLLTNSEKPSAKTSSSRNSRTQSSERLKCDKCSQSFPTRSSLQVHIKSCVNLVRKYACAECCVTFKRRTHMTKHMLQNHGGYKCETCVPDIRFPAWSDCKRHMNNNICMRFQCPQCELKFPKPSHMTAHVLEVHGGLKCFGCQKNFKVRDSLRAHFKQARCRPNQTLKRTPKSKTAFLCKDANDRVNFFVKAEQDLSDETLTQQPIDSPSPSQNTQPSQTVSSSQSSKRPSNRITRPVPPPVKRQKVEKSPTNSEKPSDKSSSSAKPRTQNSDGFKCGGCSQSFSAGSDLRKHSKSCVNVSRGKFVCAECSVTCKSRSDMDKHMLQCHGGYKCETCVSDTSDRRYTAWKNLKAHLSKNICNATRFQCPQCDLKFMTATLRTAHILEEHGCHRCVKCQKNFSREATFKWHIRKSLCGLNRNPKRTSKSEKEVFHKDPKGGNDVFIKQEHEISVEPTTQQQIRCSAPSQSAQPSQTVSSSESSKPISNSIARPVSPLVERLKVEKPPTNSEKPSAKTIPNVNTRTENSDGLVCNNCSQSFSAGSYLNKHLKSCVNVSRG